MRFSLNLKATSLEANGSQREEICKTEIEDEDPELRQTQETSVATCIALTATSNSCSVVQSQLDSGTKVKNIHAVGIVNIACHGSDEVARNGT